MPPLQSPHAEVPIPVPQPVTLFAGKISTKVLKLNKIIRVGGSLLEEEIWAQTYIEGEGGHLRAKEGASGETNLAHTLISDFWHPEL